MSRPGYDSPRCRVVGLTSPAHRGFVERTGCYDRVVAYADVASLAREAAAYVDMAGNASVLGAVHHHFGDELTHSCLVGATHWEARGGAARGALPGPKPQLFFAPDRIRARVGEWGAAGFDARVEASWRGFADAARGWITVTRRRGEAAVRAAYLEVLENRALPERGYELALNA